MTKALSGQIEINAPASVVWTILGEEFSQISKWAGIIKSSFPDQEHLPPEGADAGARICVSQIAWAKDVTEKLTAFDPQEKTFTYEATSGLPGFVQHAQNTWTVRPVSPGSCIVTTQGVLKMTPLLGRILYPIIRKQLEKAGAQLVMDLKSYAEHQHSANTPQPT